jgi:hypothetical protein
MMSPKIFHKAQSPVKMDPALYVPVTVVHDLTIFPPINKLVKACNFPGAKANEDLI